ncbi:(d)CMP kinase [Cryomorpha ignava]|uniref:Cytidylate kinase n=1 Tax=Cryomorpha ignava TaxID=101383 RepID=A0A7K3WVY6_9FLAO|nr:(d)CMP kinase [Cryomorpha ignava]NEN25859.1 (d)CMP kinase [Cryomorpha ignava]
MERKINIAIDGYSSCGKSTLAKGIAKALGYAYIDSGAMYRAVTLYAIRNGLSNNDEIDESGLETELDNITVDFTNSNGMNMTRLNGEIVENEIRNMEVSALVSQVSRIKKVREKLRLMQQDASRFGGVVMDGRDIGSAVLPFAELKIFMTANKDIRAMRRFEELAEKGETITLEEIRANLEKRDLLDTTRKENPLVQVPDALLLDNTKMTEKEQLNQALDWAKELIFETS